MKKNLQDSFSRRQIGEIATAYSNGNYGYHHFLQQYAGFNQHNFYTLLHVAVEKQIVSVTIARKIQQVAVANSEQKARENYSDGSYAVCIGSRIFNSWEKRIVKAKRFKFSKKEAKSLIEKYSKSNLSKSEFCKVNCVSIQLFDNTLIDSVIYSWVSDECFDRLYDKELRLSDVPEQVEHLFWQLTKSRWRNVMSKKK